MNIDTNALITRLLNNDLPLSDAEHDAFLVADRKLYAALLRLSNLSPDTLMAIIQRLLAVTDVPTAGISKAEENNLILQCLPYLPVSSVLQGFLNLVKRRVNNQRTSGWIRSYIFGSPQLENWAVNYRRDLRRLIRHALGQQVTLTCLHKFAQNDTAYLRRYVLRYAEDQALVRDVFLFLFGKLTSSQFPLLNAYLSARKDIEAGKGLPLKVLQGLRGTFHPQVSLRSLRRLAAKDKIKRDIISNDESLIGKIRSYYKSGIDLNSVNQAIDQQVARLPNWNSNIYFIVDTSASMQGFGHREYNNLAIAVGLLKVFQKLTNQPTDNEFPKASGTTCLAPALIEAAKQSPDLIVLISDGYENVEQGDAAMVLKGLKQLGIKIPMFHIIPAFTEREKIADRLPLPECPYVLETGQHGFLSTWLRIRTLIEPESLSSLLREGAEL
jgi:hypothetical protein